MSGGQRRKSPRRKLQTGVGLLIDGQYFKSELYEVGEGGMLALIPKECVRGQRLLATLHIPGMELPVFVPGRIAYSSETIANGFGVQFEKMDFGVKRALRNFVASSSEPSN